MSSTRPSDGELAKKIKAAEAALIGQSGLYANLNKAVGELYELDIESPEQTWQLILDLLKEIVPTDYAGGRPPQKSYEKAIYRNNLKNREYGKEAAQIFVPGASDHCLWQGASEGQKFAAKPTTPKTDSSGYFGIEGQELFAFCWESQKLRKRMYLKFVLKGDRFYYVSLHRSKEPL